MCLPVSQHARPMSYEYEPAAARAWRHWCRIESCTRPLPDSAALCPLHVLLRIRVPGTLRSRTSSHVHLSVEQLELPATCLPRVFGRLATVAVILHIVL